MNKYKVLIFIFIFLIILLSSSCIYASETNQTTLQAVDETANNITPLTQTNNNDDGSFDELTHNIENLKNGDTYTLDKDYHFDTTKTNGRCISIKSDNVTINGDGHYIDRCNKPLTLKITGNNIQIQNLNLHNCQGYGETISIKIDGNPTHQYSTTMSPIHWKGANGTINNCIFTQNTGINGGAITWTGSNGLIKNTQFINNTANGVGGAIYINGENTTITNTKFTQSHTQLLNESIYLDKKQHGFHYNKITYKGQIFCIDGTHFNVDAVVNL